MPPVNRRQFLEKSSKAGIGAGLVGLAGCSGGGDGGGGDGGGGDGGGDGGGGPEPVKIGAAISKSGQLAANGKAFSDGYNVMVKWLNEEYGGLKMGGERRPIELIEYDDESNCETTVRLVEKLITEDEVDLVLGPYSSGCTYAAVPAVKKHDMIMIEGAGIADKIFKDHNQDKIWVFGTTPPASRYILGSVRFPASKGIKKVGMFSDQGTFAQGLRAAAKAELEKQGMEVVVDATVPQDARDLSSPITKMKNRGAEFAMFNTHLELSVIAHNEAKEQGYNPKLIYGGSGVAETEFWEALGEDSIGTTNYTTWTEGLTTPGNPPFGMGNQKAGETYNKYRDAGSIKGQELDPWTSRRANGIQVVQAAAHALEETGSTDNAKIRETMKNMSAQGIMNKLEFDELGRTKGIGYCGQRQGETKNPIVYPGDVATGEPIFPKPAWK